MKTLIVLISLFVSQAYAQSLKFQCTSSDNKVISVEASGAAITLRYGGEAVPGDGEVTPSEIDVVAKFHSIGEVTIYSSVNKRLPSDYMFVQGKKQSVVCR